MECERSDPATPLRQGDIVAAHPGTDAWKNPWSRFAIILSADCDLEQYKTGPTIVCVPIVSHYTYLVDAWLPMEASRLSTKVHHLINSRLSTLDTGLTSRHVMDWGKREGKEGILRQLEEIQMKRADLLLRPKDQESITKLWEAAQSLETLSKRPELSQTERFHELLKELVGWRVVIEPPAQSGGAGYGKKMVLDVLNSLQDRLDTWLVRELIGLDPDMTMDIRYGFVVLRCSTL